MTASLASRDVEFKKIEKDMERITLVAESLDEQTSGRRLMIYQNRDGSYDAVRDFTVYHFMWNPATYRAYDFRRMGTVTGRYVPGELVRRPHIQMILQVQRSVNALNSKATSET